MPSKACAEVMLRISFHEFLRIEALRLDQNEKVSWLAKGQKVPLNSQLEVWLYAHACLQRHTAHMHMAMNFNGEPPQK